MLVLASAPSLSHAAVPLGSVLVYATLAIWDFPWVISNQVLHAVADFSLKHLYALLLTGRKSTFRKSVRSIKQLCQDTSN